ncbi:MAG: response regulator [Spirochaetes bacterium]|nr:response regulator [Spirochaetota bacterium]
MASVLIVDDSKFMRKILRESLESGGHTVIDEADNGSDGIEKFCSLKPDFVTMDITMGGLDGMKAVKAIFEQDPMAKVLVVSALNENTIKMNDSGIKASAYITKPFDRDQLLQAIAGLLK